LKTTGYQTYKRSEESQSIIQIIRPAEESDLWKKEEGFKRRTKSRIGKRKAEGIR